MPLNSQSRNEWYMAVITRNEIENQFLPDLFLPAVIAVIQKLLPLERENKNKSTEKKDVNQETTLP